MNVVPWPDDAPMCPLCGVDGCTEHVFAPVVPTAVDETAAPSRLLDDVELMHLEDPAFLVEGVLSRNGRAVIYGASGAAKTTLVAGLLVAVATGRNWFGHQILHRGHSAYVACEDVSGFKTRLRAAKLAAGLSLETAIGVYTFPDPIDLRDPASVRRFIAFVQATAVTLELVVIDTYAGATPGAAENSSEDTTVSMAAAQQIGATLHCGVVLVHHTNAAGARERGHSSMRGAADTMIAMTMVDDEILVECSKQRNAAPFESLRLKLVPIPEGGCVLRHSADVLPTTGLTLTQAKVYHVLRDTFEATGATKSEWRSACQDVSERSFYRVTKVLTEQGLVIAERTRFRINSERVV